MARNNVPQFTPFPLHITDRCPNREVFPTDIGRTWEIMCNELSLAHYKNGLKIHAFVLMPNHFHLLASVTEIAVGRNLCELLGNSSRTMNFESQLINQRWGDRAFRTEVKSFHDYTTVYKYIYQNPVRARLCSRAEAWPYSTLNGLLGLSKLLVPLEPDLLFSPEGLPSFDTKNIDWINQLTSKEDLNAIRSALRKREFNLARFKGGPNPLVNRRP